MWQKRTRRSHKGSAYLYVITVFTMVTMFSALMLATLRQTTYQFHVYSLKMQAYYLTREAEDATVAALLQRNPSSATSPTLLEKIKNGTGSWGIAGYSETDTMIHYPGNDHTVPNIGRSQIILTKETHPYYGENKSWAVARITTTIPDPRRGDPTDEFTYVGSVMVMLDNKEVRIYNIDPDSLT